MRARVFTRGSPGRLEPTTVVEHEWREGRPKAKRVRGLGFVPDPLPPSIALGELLEATYPRLIAAERNLSQFEGSAKRLPNPHLLLGVFSRREAILSSRIENTFASAEELALFEGGSRSGDARDQVREVRNYVSALEHGLDSPLPICLRLIREMHERLLQGVDSPASAPGRFRNSQNAIGADRSFADAKFVPPPPQYVDKCLSDLERYIHREDELPRLIRFGLIHYQFETIHPFLDGNGRIGRLMVALMMCREAQLTRPFVYVSGFFEQHRDRYYDLLFRVSTEAVWLEWLEFFLEAVATQAEDALARSDRLLSLRAEYHKRVRQKRASALLPRLVDELFARPAITVSAAEKMLGCTAQSATNLIMKLVEKKILVEATGRSYGRVFLSRDIVQLIKE